MPPVVSIVGKSSTGKTTFLEKLLRELTGRGYKVATIKHSHHSIDFDDPRKDSYRHARAGSAIVMVSSTTSFQIIKQLSRELTIDELARNLDEEYDLVLTEGFSRGNAPKVEIHRKEAGPPLESPSQLIAIATDEPLDTDVKQFGLEDFKGVADLLVENYILPNRERASLYVNGEKLPLPGLPSDLIARVRAALGESLKDSQEIGSLEFRYYKEKRSGNRL